MANIENMTQTIKLIILLLIIAWSVEANAQLSSVYFEINNFKLSNSTKLKLDNFYSSQLSTNYPDVIVKGYSDTTGTSEINLKLSKQRVESVKEYLTTKGYPTHKIKIEYFGETETESESLKKNRRVDLFVNPNFNIYNFLSKYNQPEQVFQIDNTHDTIIKAKQNTTIYIPSNCFMLVNGEKVKNVTLILQENYEISDILLSNLTTQTTNGNLLETKGMLNISVISNGQECVIAKGKSISLGIANIPDPTDFDLYQGETSNNRSVIWEDSTTQPLIRYGIERRGPRHQKYRTAFISHELDSSFENHIDDSLYFPLDALNEGICGQINVNFKVNSKGRISQTFIGEKDGLHPSIDSLVVDLIRNCPPTRPMFKKDKKALKFWYTETFAFYSDACSRGLKRFSIEEQLKPDHYSVKWVTTNPLSIMNNKDTIDVSDVKNISTVVYSTTQLGWLNVDKLKKIKGKKAKIEVNVRPAYNIDFKIIMQDYAAVIIGEKTNEKFIFKKLPKNQKGILIGLKYDNDKIFLATKELFIDDTEINEIEFREVSVTELKARLNELKK